MKIKMTSSRYASPCGFGVQLFIEGNVYEVNQSLAAYFLSREWCIACVEGI